MLLLSSKAFFVRFCDVDKTLQINATVIHICNRNTTLGNNITATLFQHYGAIWVWISSKCIHDILKIRAKGAAFDH